MYYAFRKIRYIFVVSFFVVFLLPPPVSADESESVSPDALAADSSAVVLEDSETTQSVQNLIVNNLVLPVPEEEELEVYILGSQASLEHIPNQNVVIFQGTFNNRGCYVVFPVSYAASLYVTDGGILTNVSGSNIVGRVFYDDSFSITDYDYTTLTLSSILASGGATASYRYGYPSYITEYRSGSGSSLFSSSTYGNFYVTERIDADVSSVDYEMYLLMVALVIIQGSMMIFGWLRIAKN